MRNTARKILLLACSHALLGMCAHAQGTGTLRFKVDPGDSYQFVLDGKYRMQEREVKLLEGPHSFTFWAPSRSMVDTVLRVVPGRTTDVVLRLPYSAEYLAYQNELKRQRKDQWLGRVLPSVVTLGAGIWAVGSFVEYKDAHEQLQADEHRYTTSADPYELQQLKQVDVPTHRSDFKQARDMFYLSGGVPGLCRVHHVVDHQGIEEARSLLRGQGEDPVRRACVGSRTTRRYNGHGPYDPHPMKRIMLLPLLVLLTGCYKDDLAPSAWTNNPFDPDYTGTSVFHFDTTYIETVGAPPASITRQVVQFSVNSGLFLAPNEYQVRVRDLQYAVDSDPNNDDPVLLPQYPAGSDVWRYTKLDFTFGQELCLEVRLANNFHYARPETICATLQ
jgi:hypothetical protein